VLHAPSPNALDEWDESTAARATPPMPQQSTAAPAIRFFRFGPVRRPMMALHATIMLRVHW
jgi:hypothetical protein